MPARPANCAPAARREGREASQIDCAAQGKTRPVQLQRHGVRQQAGRGQVPELKPRDPEAPQERRDRGPSGVPWRVAARGHLTARSSRGVRVTSNRAPCACIEHPRSKEEARKSASLTLPAMPQMVFNVTYLIERVEHERRDDQARARTRNRARDHRARNRPASSSGDADANSAPVSTNDQAAWPLGAFQEGGVCAERPQMRV